MSTVDPTRLIADLIAGEQLTSPTVKTIEPEVRSGGFFPFCDLLKYGEDKEETKGLLDKSILLGALMIEWGYDVPYEKHEAFKGWLQKYEAKLAAAVPAGVTYRGTYAVSASSEKHTGRYRTIWAFETLGALGSFSEAMHVNNAFAQLVVELSSYRDRERGANYSEQIYQPVRCAQRLG